MKYKLSLLTVFLFFLLSSLNGPSNNWIRKTGKAFNMNYTENDKPYIKEYEKLIDTGIHSVTTFFDTAYKNKFDVFIQPDRRSLDSTWSKNWGKPGFKSECWMVAGGIATRIDIISPRTWDTASCEHKYEEKEKMQQLITHELVHVFHGQQNVSPDFNNTENIDWFVEGVANYASGQCDSAVLLQIKELIDSRTYPKTLDLFRTGNLRYGLSGSMVMYIDKKYGRRVLKSLLKFNKKQEILDRIGITEQALLTAWAKYFK